MRTNLHRTILATLLSILIAMSWASQRTSGATPVAAAKAPSPAAALSMSHMGQRARRAVHAVNRAAGAASAATLRSLALKEPPELGDEEEEGGGPGPLEDGGELPGGNQGELSIAVDDSGRHVVIGFNDARGFLTPPTVPLSVSGFMYSDDGGRTFVDGGRLPVTTGVTNIGTATNPVLLPQVFGDPDVKYLGGCNFVYTSILVAAFGSGSAVQTMGFHRSRDCGHSWQGPFEITAASNPNGRVDANGNPEDAADKEQIDVDRTTGRVIMTWTNFSDELEISSTYSDNVLAPAPTWSPRVIIADRPDVDGQAATPRFGPAGSHLVYASWETVTPDGFAGESFARSTDGGVTFSPPIDLDPGFFPPDQILGNDRIHWFPTIAVDRSPGRHRGNVYVAYGENNALDGDDIVVRTSSNRGLTFGAAVTVNARPGGDRSQWFPYLTVNDRTGRVLLFYYDQGVADSGDLMQVSYTFSDDGGRTWAAARPLSDRPFHGGWGNDTGQPNLGDYNQAVVNRSGDLLGAFAMTHQVGFRDNQPLPIMSVPEPVVSRVRASDQAAVTTVDLRGTSAVEATRLSNRNGFLDPGDSALVSLQIRNYVTNPMNDRAIDGALAVVESTTPHARTIGGVTFFPRLAPGETKSSLIPVLLQLDGSFHAGDDVNLSIEVFSLNGLPMTLEAMVHTGTPVPTPLLAQNFDGVAPGALPGGWTAAHGAGGNTVPWTTSRTFCGSTSNGAFHVNANDGTNPLDNARWERLFSPTLTVPADAQWVEVEFDVCTDTEDDPNFNVQAFDGAFLRITDLTPGGALRSVLVEAFEQDFITGGRFGYPKHFPRNGNPNYFEDMSAWAGDSHGLRHVRMRLPGMAGATVQLRFEFAQDDFFTCAEVRPGHACGVLVDNVKVTSFTAR
jgi:hypothetical protein